MNRSPLYIIEDLPGLGAVGVVDIVVLVVGSKNKIKMLVY